MILKVLFSLITGVINLIPFSLPSLPEKFNTTLDFIFTNIKGSLGIIDLFIDLKFWITCAGVMVLLYNIKHVWNTIVYLLNLIPTVDIPFWK